jgi:4-diphosphocytidyl-2-C-methyl-D-erythritol kinase
MSAAASQDPMAPRDLGPPQGPVPSRGPMPLPLRARAPAKINLGLFLGPPRADGRHELVSVMQSISLADQLTLSVADGRTAAATDEVVCPGVPGPPGENLAAAALVAFRAASRWSGRPLRLRIEKRVPVAAGLGGGSGDAAAALRLAAAASGLGEEALLLELACALGADVPAQVRPGRWLASGAGEQLRALPAPRASFGVLVLPSARGLSTAAVYAQADELALARPTAALEEHRAALAHALADGAALPAADLLANDLQDAARALAPEIDAALAQARAAGADSALLSGSGPTVLGLFAGVDGPDRARAAASALVGERSAAGEPAALAAEPVGERFAAVERAPAAD